MTDEERHSYNCEKKFGFRKGSSKFQDCRFKLYTTEMELKNFKELYDLLEQKQ